MQRCMLTFKMKYSLSKNCNKADFVQADKITL